MTMFDDVVEPSSDIMLTSECLSTAYITTAESTLPDYYKMLDSNGGVPLPGAYSGRTNAETLRRQGLPTSTRGYANIVETLTYIASLKASNAIETLDADCRCIVNDYPYEVINGRVCKKKYIDHRYEIGVNGETRLRDFPEWKALICREALGLAPFGPKC